MVSESPKFDEREIASGLIYPPIALRSNIEGRVILELFVDRNGVVQRITILLEDPKARGFVEAAIRAFTGKAGVPAKANGEAVSARYRYPVSFRIK
jgi:protein TonB